MTKNNNFSSVYTFFDGKMATAKTIVGNYLPMKNPKENIFDGIIRRKVMLG